MLVTWFQTIRIKAVSEVDGDAILERNMQGDNGVLEPLDERGVSGYSRHCRTNRANLLL